MSRPLARFALGALLASMLVALLAFFTIGSEPATLQAAQGFKAVNPLYATFRAIGDREGIDVSFAREVVSERNGPTIEHPLFSMPERSVDVLIFGDSTAAWGIIPQVIEGVSGLRVAMFAEPGLPLNEAQCPFYRAVIERYLAPDGRVLFFFAPKNLQHEPEVPFSRILTGERLARALARTDVNDQWSFERYWGWRNDTLVEPLTASGMRLPHMAPYRSWLEQYVNPGWFAQKQDVEARQSQGFIRWDGWTAIMYGPNKQFSRREVSEPKNLARWLPRPEVRARLERNAEATSHLPGQKVFVVPWSKAKVHYLRFRAVYQKYFADFAGLIDLGKLHPENKRYPMSDNLHMRNETGVEASVLLGKWLRQNPIAQRGP